MPQRLAELVTAIGREPDPVVRGRAAVQLLRDLARAQAAAQQALDGAMRDLRSAGLSEQRIGDLLDLSPQPSVAAEPHP